MIPVLPLKRVYNNILYGVFHHCGERDAEPTHLQEHRRVRLLAETVEAHARGPEGFMQSTTTGCFRKIWFATKRYAISSVADPT